jgi:hypothetical protein
MSARNQLRDRLTLMKTAFRSVFQRSQLREILLLRRAAEALDDRAVSLKAF